MKIEFDNNIPIYIQLVEQLKLCIISGEFELGQRLPSVRELANLTKVNPNTMQRALAELETLGLVITERTSGKFVTTDGELIENYKKEYAQEIVEKYFVGMSGIGYDRKGAIEYLKSMEDYDLKDDDKNKIGGNY